MELELEYFDDEVLSSDTGLNILVLGDKKSGKSTLVKTIIEKINKSFKNGNVCTDSQHYTKVYSDFLEVENIYKRYSTLISKRCFVDNYYLVLDEYYYTKNRYDEIFSNRKKFNMNLIVSLTKLTDFMDYSYIFICAFTDIKEITKLYKHYISKHNIFKNLSNFIHFINLSTTDYDVIVINLKTLDADYLFTYYNSKQFTLDS